MKTWLDLTDIELTIFESLNDLDKYPEQERKSHRVCTKCWFWDLGDTNVTA